MACSSSQTSETIHGLGTITRINDAVYEFHRPATGFIELDIVFFHGFQVQGSKDAYFRTWMLADGSACWLNTWLPEEYPQSRIISVSYDSSTERTDSEGRMDMYVVGENLARSIIELAGVGQSCPVVLVGHGVGGLVLKEVCYRAEQLGSTAEAEGAGINPYKTFLTRMKGAFFYSTPHLGTRIQANPQRRSPLLKYYELLNTDSARLNSAFQDLRKPHRYGWKTFGIIEANITDDCETVIRLPSAMSLLFGWKPQSSPMVEEGSARNDMDDFCVLDGEDSSTICKPKERSSSSFQILLQFVRGIVKDEEWALKNWQFTLGFPPVFINMPNRVENVLQTLQLGQAEPSRVSLVGMGGIGKSTLAKELLVEIQSQFDLVSFVDDVKGRLKHQNLHTLIADNLYYGNGTKVRMHDVDVRSLSLLVKGKKVLLIMDNVDSEEQISTLRMRDWVAKGSRLVVTSRERTEELMPTFVVYEVPFLSTDESENLFRAHVNADVIEQIPSDIFHQVLAKCDGLPLTLEVIGSYLGCEKDLSIWKEVLDRLRKAESINGSVNDRLWAKLRVSLDNLSPPELRMFLDLAVLDKCEPNGLQYDLQIWRIVWDAGIDGSMVSSGLRNLVHKCLIRISRNFWSWRYEPYESELQYLALSKIAEFVRIHEQLRDMGKSIVRRFDEKVEVRRGVWQSEDVDELLAKYKGDNAHTEVLSVAPNHSKKLYTWSSIGHLRQLRLLSMFNVGMTGNGAQRFPSSLAFLHMRTCFRRKAKRALQFLESDYWPIRAEDVGGLHKMTVLVLENCSPVRFPENFHKLSNLRLLILNGEQLTKLPKKFGLLPSLQVLVLENVGLTKLPDSFLQLSSLESLKLSGCSGLKALPDWPVPKYTLPSPLCALTRLTLQDLPGLRELPENFGLILASIEKLSINRCSALFRLPESLSMCRQLKELSISECESLEDLGESFGELESLSYLFISVCRSVRCLPESLGQLKALRVLEIHHSPISSLPASIWNLQKLSELWLASLTELRGLPEWLRQMDSLRSFQISSCKRLQALPESFGLLRNLRELDIQWCDSLQSLPERLGELENLQTIHIRNCMSLERFPESFGQLQALAHLQIAHCNNLKLAPESLEQLKAQIYIS